MNNYNYNYNYRIIDKIKSNSVDLPLPINTTTQENNDIRNLKNKRKIFLNTSTIKDKTPKKIKTSFLIDNNNNKSKKNNNFIKNKFYINTLENNNNNYIKNTNIRKSTDEGRYSTFKDNESISANATRANHFSRFLLAHKRHNFSQEPEKKKKENDTLEIFTTGTYGKGNSFILSNPNYYVNKLMYNNYKNLIYDKQNQNKFENKNNGNNGMNIYTNKSFEKIKESVEKVNGNKIVNITKNKNSQIKCLECKYKEGENIISFTLNVAQNPNKKNYLVISPNLIKGKSSVYNSVIERIKNKLK